jgi:hypothetical protein
MRKMSTVELPSRVERLPGDDPARFRIAPAPGRDRGTLATAVIFAVIGLGIGGNPLDSDLARRLFSRWLWPSPAVATAIDLALGIATFAYGLWQAARVFLERQEVDVSPAGIVVTTKLPLFPARVERLPAEAGAGARWLPGLFGLQARIELPGARRRLLARLDEREARPLVEALRAAGTSALPARP